MALRRVSKKPSAVAAGDEMSSAATRDAIKGALAAGLEKQLGKLSSSSLAAGLYLVSTPIGNLSDISIRALFVVAAADLVLCEDTRHSRKLFSAYGIHNKLQAYHDFSGEKDRAGVMEALGEGRAVALISDAGTPLIADPGFKLVRAAIADGFNVFAIPGPSAILCALVASGLPTDRFFFEGFLPAKEMAKRQTLENLRNVPGTLILYETGGRLESTLEALLAVFPDRSIVLARELTKLYEAFARGSAAELLQSTKESPPPGEFVVLVGPGETMPATDLDVEMALAIAMKTASLKEAVEEVAKGLGAGKKLVYNLALKLRDRDK